MTYSGALRLRCTIVCAVSVKKMKIGLLDGVLKNKLNGLRFIAAICGDLYAAYNEQKLAHI